MDLRRKLIFLVSAVAAVLIILVQTESVVSAFDQVGSVQVLEVQVSNSEDDAEERESGGMRIESSDLELTRDDGDQTIGVRFRRVAIPAGSTIEAAYVQFTADDTSREPTRLRLAGEKSLRPGPFDKNRRGLSGRPTTSNSVDWSPAPWERNEAGPRQRTPELKAIIQEIVDQPGWQSGAPMVLLITGAGLRSAASFDGQRRDAPLMHIEFSVDGESRAATPNGEANTAPNGVGAAQRPPAPESDFPREIGPGRVLRVPDDYQAIQTAIEAAEDGDTVLVAPGIYQENLVLSGASITLASHFLNNGDPTFIEQTVIDGRNRDIAIDIRSDLGPGTAIIGFTIRNARDGIRSRSPFDLLHNRITDTRDGVDYEGGGGIVRSNVFDGNGDDAIDLDGDTALLAEGNLILDSGDDGVEIRLHRYEGPTLEITFRDNVISGSDEDGVQLIDYPGLSSRVLRFERNLITANRMAGIGMTSDGNSRQTFEAADVLEPVIISHNTISGNDHGISGGDAVSLRNNIVMKSKVGLKGVDGSSTVSHLLLWQNEVPVLDSNIGAADSVLEAEPLLDEEYRPLPGSPAIDAGTDVGLPFQGKAPDLGFFESAE